MSESTSMEPCPKTHGSWLNGALVASVHVTSIVSLFAYWPKWQTVVLMLVTWRMAGLGIAMGYNQVRLKGAHKATTPLRFILMLMGSAAWQGSIKSWDLWKHRDEATNRQYVSRMGWMFGEESEEDSLPKDASKLFDDPIVHFQYTYYPFIALFTGLVAPTIISGFLWNDYLGGYLYAGLMSKLLIWHESSILRSSSPLGSQEDKQFDTAIWALNICEILGFAHHVSPDNTTKGKDVLQEQKLEPIPNRSYTMSEFRALVKEHPTRLFMIVEDKVVDVTQFINEHPGGPRMMKMFTGKDGTPGFLGGWNFHSKSAHLKLKQLQMGTFIQGSESDEECDDYDLDGKNEGVLVGQSDHAKED